MLVKCILAEGPSVRFLSLLTEVRILRITFRKYIVSVTPKMLGVVIFYREFKCMDEQD